jgi:hypothetical protein
MNRSDIDSFAFSLFQMTRSVGMEHGSDLLLQLIYLRGTSDGNWRKLHDVMTRDVGSPTLMVEELVGRTVEPWKVPPLPIEVDDRTIRNVVSALDAWPFESRSEEDTRALASGLFEAVLRLRSERLSLAGSWSETPLAVAELMAAVVVKPGDRICDPACGLGTALLASAAHGAGRLVGIEVNESTLARASMRFELAAVAADLLHADSLRQDDTSALYDAVLLHPPFGQGPSDELLQSLPPYLLDWSTKRSSELVWLRRALSLVRPEGRAAVLTGTGLLFRSGREADLRSKLIQRGEVEAVITLPGSVTGPARIPWALWLLRGSSLADERDEVLFVDAAPVIAALSETQQPDGTFAEVVGILERWREAPDELDAEPHVARALPVRDVTREGASLLPARFLEQAPEHTAVRPEPPARLLTQLRLKNLKSFSGDHAVDLRPITVIYGPNSAGKSSLLQALLLLKQSIEARTLVTQGELTDGGSFEGLVHRHDTDSELLIGVTYGALDRWTVDAGVPDPSLLRGVDFSFGTNGSELPDQRWVRFTWGETEATFTRSLQAPVESSDLSFALPLDDAATVFGAVAEGTFLYPFDTRHQARVADPSEEERRRRGRQANARRARRLLEAAGVTAIPIAAAGLLPSAGYDKDLLTRVVPRGNTREEGIVSSYVKRSVQVAAGTGAELRLLLGELTYLAPLRSAPQRYYNRAVAVAGAGTAGEDIALHLFDNASEVDEINRWLQKLGITYALSVIPVRALGGAAIIGDNVAIVLTDSRSKIESSPADVGFGVSQILPIVVQLLSKRETVICIEQPEIHIHPKLQTRLADLMIDAASTSGRANQLIVETHSEHLLLRLQRRVREGLLAAEDLAVLYVDQDDSGAAHIRRLRMDEKGYFVDPWPAGFFDEALHELFGGSD